MRIHHWQTALVEVLQKYRDEPFKWGEFDCSMLAADCALAVCGKDPAAGLAASTKAKSGPLVRFWSMVRLLTRLIATLSVPRHQTEVTLCSLRVAGLVSCGVTEFGQWIQSAALA